MRGFARLVGFALFIASFMVPSPWTAGACSTGILRFVPFYIWASRISLILASRLQTIAMPGERPMPTQLLLSRAEPVMVMYMPKNEDETRR
jgi:hypothetical protein